MKRAGVALTTMAKRSYGKGTIYQRGSVWWIQYFRKGKLYSESSKTRDRAEAQRLLHQRLGEIATDRFQGLASRGITISQLCDLVIEDYKFKKRRTVKDVEWRTEKHLRGDVGAIKAVDFGSAQIKKYISGRRAEGVEDSTINRETSIIRRGFSIATKEADPPLLARAPFIPKLKEDNVRQGFLEHSEYLQLRDALPARLRAMFVVAYHAGMRLGELRKIQWPQVDLDAGEIRIEKKQAKNEEPRTIPIYSDMRPWLEMQKAERDQNWPNSPWVFHYLGKPIGSHIKGFVEACVKAGLPKLRAHDLRRSAIRNMERAAVPRSTAMKFSGHKTESVYRRYDIVSQQDMKLGAAKLEKYLEGLKSQATTTKTTTVEEKPN